MDYVMERYIGKTRVLMEAELVLGQLIKEMRENPLKDYTNHPLNEKLCALITKQFNFKNTFIRWKGTPEHQPNISTLFTSSVLTRPGAVKASIQRGYYGDGKDNCYIIASCTVAKQLNLTTEEYMAILLHEIGHNFDASLYMIFRISLMWLNAIAQALPRTIPVTVFDGFGGAFTTYQTVPGNFQGLIRNSLYTTNPGKGFLNAITKLWDGLLANLPVLKKIAYFFGSMLSFFNKALETIFSVPVLLTAPISILLSPLSHITTLPTRKGEQFADSFAATYGYATQLGTALDKLQQANMLKVGKTDNEIVNIMRDLTLLNRSIMHTCMGTHGSTGTRIKSNIQFLQSEVTSSQYPPEMKKELLKQINELENLYNSYINGDDKKKLAMTISMRKIVDRAFNGRSDFIAKLFPDIETKWETADTTDECKLAIYESYYNNEISEYSMNKLLSFYE